MSVCIDVVLVRKLFLFVQRYLGNIESLLSFRPMWIPKLPSMRRFHPSESQAYKQAQYK